MVEKKVIFRLKRNWVIDGKTMDLYEEIKEGRKRIEYRDATFYWGVRLLEEPIKIFACRDVYSELADFTSFLKVKRAWFVVGFPKGSLPRLEADITKLEYDPSGAQFRIYFDNVVEVAET